MNKLRWLAGMMGIVILVITGFQVYWLKDNYNREKKAVEVRTGALFHETVREVQDSLLQMKLILVLKDSTMVTKGLRTKVPDAPFKTPQPDQPSPAKVLNLITKMVLSDSLSNKEKKEVYISVNGHGQHREGDTSGKTHFVFDSLPPGELNDVIVVNRNGRVPGPHGTGDDSLMATTRLRTGELRSIARTRDKDSNNKAISQINTIYFNTDRGDRFIVKIDSLLNDSIPAPILATEFTRRL